MSKAFGDIFATISRFFFGYRYAYYSVSFIVQEEKKITTLYLDNYIAFHSFYVYWIIEFQFIFFTQDMLEHIELFTG